MDTLVCCVAGVGLMSFEATEALTNQLVHRGGLPYSLGWMLQWMPRLPVAALLLIARTSGLFRPDPEENLAADAGTPAAMTVDTGVGESGSGGGPSSFWETEEDDDEDEVVLEDESGAVVSQFGAFVVGVATNLVMASASLVLGAWFGHARDIPARPALAYEQNAASWLYQVLAYWFD